MELSRGQVLKTLGEFAVFLSIIIAGGTTTTWVVDQFDSPVRELLVSALRAVPPP